MAKFLIDEGLPRSLAQLLKDGGHEVVHVRDLGLSGASDDVVFRSAQEAEAVLVSGDLGFANVTRFPLGQHFGIVVVRIPATIPIGRRVAEAAELIGKIPENELKGILAIIQPGRVRIRRVRPQ